MDAKPGHCLFTITSYSHDEDLGCSKTLITSHVFDYDKIAITLRRVVALKISDLRIDTLHVSQHSLLGFVI